MAKAEALAEQLASGSGAAHRAILLDLVERVTVGEGTIGLSLKRAGLAARLLGETAPKLDGVIYIEADGVTAETGGPDPALVKAVARGHAWFEDLVSGRAASVRDIARREGLSHRYVSRLIDLAFLPPKAGGGDPSRDAAGGHDGGDPDAGRAGVVWVEG